MIWNGHEERGHQLHHGTQVLKVSSFSHPPSSGFRTRYCSDIMKEEGSGIWTIATWHLLATVLCSYASATATWDEERQQRRMVLTKSLFCLVYWKNCSTLVHLNRTTTPWMIERSAGVIGNLSTGCTNSWEGAYLLHCSFWNNDIWVIVYESACYESILFSDPLSDGL